MYSFVVYLYVSSSGSIISVGEERAIAQKYSPDADLKINKQDMTNYTSTIAREPYLVGKVRWQLLIDTSSSLFNLFM